FFKAAVASSGNHDNNIYNNSWSERYHGMKEVPAELAKTLATNTTGTQTGQGGRGQGLGGRGGGGRGGNRGGGGDDPDADIKALEAEILSLIDVAVDPDDAATVAEIEKKIAELNKQLAALKVEDAKAAGGSTTKTEDKKTATSTSTSGDKKDDK